MKILFILSLMFLMLFNVNCTKNTTNIIYKQNLIKDTTIYNSIFLTLDSLQIKGYLKN